MLTFVVIALLVVVAFFAAATHDWLNGAPETPQALTEPEYVDPLEEEFRALEDAVLKRDDPSAWHRKHGRPIQARLANDSSWIQHLNSLPRDAQYAAQLQNMAQGDLMRQMQMQNAFYNRKAEGFLGGIPGGIGSLFASNKPPE